MEGACWKQGSMVCVLHWKGLQQLFLRLHTGVFKGRTGNKDAMVRKNDRLKIHRAENCNIENRCLYEEERVRDYCNLQTDGNEC